MSKKLFALLFVLVLLAALAPVSAQSSGGGGGTLVGAFDVGPGGAPDTRPYMDSAGRTWLIKIWSPLVSWNKDATDVVPQLATSWEFNSDATVWTFHLREGVKFHDGVPFTADDVKFSLELAYNPDAATTFPGFSQLAADAFVGGADYVNGNATEISGIKVIDDHTIEFDLTKPDPRLTYKLVMAWVLPKHALQDLKPSDYQTTDWFYTKAIGTGPFMQEEYKQDQYWSLVPNPDYWNGAPKLDHLINRYFQDETAAVLALQGGDIQFTYASADVALKMENDPNFKLYSGSSGVTNYLIYNLRDPIFQDKRVRQAFLYAIDRKTIAETVMQNTVEVLPCLAALSAMRPPASDLNDYAYNPDMARQLLQEAGGWPSGLNYNVDTYYTSQLALDALAAMQANLADVGITVTPKTVDVPTYNSYFYTGDGWDISYRGIGSTLNYPFQFYIKGGFDVKSGDTLMGPVFPELEDLIAKAKVETDQQKYLGLLQDICRYQNENALEGYMWTSIRYGVASSKVQDFYWAPIQGGGPYEDHPELWSVSQ